MKAFPTPRLFRFAATPGGAVGLLLIAILSVQIGASLAKSLFPVAGAHGTAALRLAFAALILWVLVRPWRRPVPIEARRVFLAYGLSLGAMNLLFYLALERVPQGLCVALEFTGPLVVSTLTARRRLDLIWVACAAGGLLLLLPVGGTTAIDPLGAGYALAAGACWGVYMVCGQKAGGLHGLSTTAWGMLVAALVVVPGGLWQEGARLFDPHLLPAAIGIAVLSSALPYTIEMFALQHMPVRSFGILMSLEPVVGALSAGVLLGERMGLREWLAIAAVILASVGTTLTAPGRPVAPAPD